MTPLDPNTKVIGAVLILLAVVLALAYYFHQRLFTPTIVRPPRMKNPPPPPPKPRKCPECGSADTVQRSDWLDCYGCRRSFSVIVTDFSGIVRLTKRLEPKEPPRKVVDTAPRYCQARKAGKFCAIACANEECYTPQQPREVVNSVSVPRAPWPPQGDPPDTNSPRYDCRIWQNTKGHSSCSKPCLDCVKEALNRKMKDAK